MFEIVLETILHGLITWYRKEEIDVKNLVLFMDYHFLSLAVPTLKLLTTTTASFLL